MGLADIVRSGIAIAKNVTAGLQVEITLEAWTGNDAYGSSTYAAKVPLSAVVEEEQRLIRQDTGDDVMSKTKVTILQPVTANGATGRREPIDPRDRIILSNGVTGPILDAKGLIDPSTNAPYMFEVWLGDIK